MKVELYGFSEAPAYFPRKSKSVPKPIHGTTGMQTILEMACSEMKGYEEAAQWVAPGSPQATFGRLHMAADGLPMPQSEYEDCLRTLAEAMENNDIDDGPAAAGQTFLGQFIDHDLTLDATTELGRAAGDVTRIRNFRTPRLDLDCVYGGGPDVSPHLYDKDAKGKLLFGRGPGEGPADGNDLDLPRNRQGTALIGDPRNDENLFVSQVHGRRFIAEHNRLVDDKGDYELAREALTHAYHTEIMESFLPDVVDPDVLSPFKAWLDGGPVPTDGNINWSHIPDMPVEFAAAAYRFGHSMVRQSYDLNADHTAVPIFGGALEGFSPVLTDHNLDFDLFFGTDAQRSRAIDTKLPTALIKLPTSVVGDGEANLAFRNMSRGQITFRMPSGEAMAGFMGKPVTATHQLVKDAGLEGNTPLWFYILAEAEAHGGKLGPVGGSIVAGVIVNLLVKGKSPLASSLTS